jgi:hypothetical protein
LTDATASISGNNENEDCRIVAKPTDQKKPVVNFVQRGNVFFLRGNRDFLQGNKDFCGDVCLQG